MDPPLSLGSTSNASPPMEPPPTDIDPRDALGLAPLDEPVIVITTPAGIVEPVLFVHFSMSKFISALLAAVAEPVERNTLSVKLITVFGVRGTQDTKEKLLNTAGA